MRPLAEALSVEERPRTRERLTAILLAFGSVGRRTIERLKTSPQPGGAADRDSPDAAVRRQRRAAGPDRAARRQRAAGPARSGARDSQHRHRRRLPKCSSRRSPSGTAAVARRDHAVDRHAARRAGDAAVRLHPAATSITAARSRRSTCAPSSRSARCATRAASRRCARRSTKANGGRRGAPRALRDAAAASALARIGTPDALAVLDEAVARGSRGVRSAARAQLSNVRPRRAGRAPETAGMTAPRVPARRRTAAPLRGGAAIGAALFAGPSDHRPQPRVALGGVPAAARPAAGGHHRPGRRRSDRRRHADGEGRHARAASSAGCSRPASSASPIDRGVTLDEHHRPSSARSPRSTPRDGDGARSGRAGAPAHPRRPRHASSSASRAA